METESEDEDRDHTAVISSPKCKKMACSLTLRQKSVDYYHFGQVEQSETSMTFVCCPS